MRLLNIKGETRPGGHPLPASRLFIIRNVRRNTAQNTSLLIPVTSPVFTYSVAVLRYRTNDGRPPREGTTLLLWGVSEIRHFTEQSKRTKFGLGRRFNQYLSTAAEYVSSLTYARPCTLTQTNKHLFKHLRSLGRGSLARVAPSIGPWLRRIACKGIERAKNTAIRVVISCAMFSTPELTTHRLISSGRLSTMTETRGKPNKTLRRRIGYLLQFLFIK